MRNEKKKNRVLAFPFLRGWESSDSHNSDCGSPKKTFVFLSVQVVMYSCVLFMFLIKILPETHLEIL